MVEQHQAFPESVEYAGFWARFGAVLIDTVAILFVTVPLTMAIYGSQYWQGEQLVMGRWDILINWLFPIAVVILFWRYMGATPGKMVSGMKVVDEKTGLPPGLKQSVIRYIGYFISMIPFMLGFLWIGIDKKKQGWHDKLSGTIVIKIKKK